MTVIELIEELRTSELRNTPTINMIRLGSTAEKVAAVEDLIGLINAGLRELHTKLSLDVTGIVHSPVSGALETYRIPDARFVHLVAVTDLDGVPLRAPEYRHNDDWDYKEVAHGQFVFKTSQPVIISYRRTCERLTSPDDELPIYDALVETLKAYIAFKLTTPFGMEEMNTQNLYYARYQQSLDMLVAQSIGDDNNYLVEPTPRGM